MNLYIFVESDRASVYGIGTYIRELTTALYNSNINVSVVNLISERSQIQTEEIDGVQHFFFPAPIIEQWQVDIKKQWELYYRNITYLLQLYIQDSRELVFHLNYNKSSKLAEELKRAFDCKIVAVTHYFSWGFIIYDNLQQLRHILNDEYPDVLSENLKKTFEDEKLYCSVADRIICMSNYMKEILCHDYGIDSAKIAVVPNGLLDTADTTNNSKFLRKKWNMPLKERIILFAGRIDEVKGLNCLIKAFRVVLKKLPCCRLVIVGNGNYDAYLQDAKDCCAKIIFTGLLEKEDLYEIYQIADVGVVPSLFESFGYVAVEMMMHGLPIVATATSGLNEVVSDNCGFKVPITALSDRIEIDTLLLAQKIVHLLQNPSEAKYLGKNARKRFLEQYSSSVFRSNMITFYRSL